MTLRDKLIGLMKELEGNPNLFSLRKLKACLDDDMIAYTAALEEELVSVRAENARQNAFILSLIRQTDDVKTIQKLAADTRAEVNAAIRGVGQLIKEVTGVYITLTEFEAYGEVTV